MRINVRSEGLIQSKLATLSHCPTALLHWGRPNWRITSRAVQMPKKLSIVYMLIPKHNTNCAAHSVLGVFVTLFSKKT